MVFQKESLPPGYKFSPTDEELIRRYLKPMVLHQLDRESVSWYIFDKDIYEYADPLLLFQDIQSSHHQAYFYTPIRKISSNGKNIKRTTGEGKWDGQQNKTIKDEDGKSIGTRRMYTFLWEDELNEVAKGHWIMHEYRLLPEFYRDHKIMQTDPEYVICEIYCTTPGEGVLPICQQPAAKRQRTTPSMDAAPAQCSPMNNNGASTSWALPLSVETSFMSAEVVPLPTLVNVELPALVPSTMNPFVSMADFEDLMFSLDDLPAEDIYISPLDNNSAVDINEASSLVVQDAAFTIDQQDDDLNFTESVLQESNDDLQQEDEKLEHEFLSFTELCEVILKGSNDDVHREEYELDREFAEVFKAVLKGSYYEPVMNSVLGWDNAAAQANAEAIQTC